MKNTSKQIEITRPLATHLLTLAQKSPEHEICGLVAERRGKPSTVYPILNVADHPNERFEMDAGELVSTNKLMREKGETVFAIFHSHPNSPPELSKNDIENIVANEAYLSIIHLIISLNTKGVLEMRAFRFADNAFEAVDLFI